MRHSLACGPGWDVAVGVPRVWLRGLRRRPHVVNPDYVWVRHTNCSDYGKLRIGPSNAPLRSSVTPPRHRGKAMWHLQEFLLKNAPKQGCYALAGLVSTGRVICTDKTTTRRGAK
jgi:hypothetical protein